MRIDARPMSLTPAPPGDAARIDTVARQMEGVFAQMMIKQMRQTTLGDSMFPGAAGQFRDLHDEQIAKSLTSGRGLGLSEMIARQLTRDAGADPAHLGGESPRAAMLPLPGRDALPMTLAGDGARAMIPMDAYVRPLPVRPLSRDETAPNAGSVSVGEVRPLALATPSSTARPNWIDAADVPRLAAGVSDHAQTARAAARAEARADVSRGAEATNASTARAGGPASPRVDAFVARVWPHAVEVGRKLGVDPRAIVAQTALETGWGRSTISANGQSANNYFGIKATGGWRGERVATTTQEFVAGGFRTENAAFRAYDGTAESFADYAALLKRLPRYADAIGSGSDIRGFAEALQRGGYATDPDYARKIEAIAKGPTLNRALARLDIDDARHAPNAPAAARSMLAAGGLGGF